MAPAPRPANTPAPMLMTATPAPPTMANATQRPARGMWRRSAGHCSTAAAVPPAVTGASTVMPPDVAMTDSVRLPTENPAALARIHQGNIHQSTETIRRTAVKSGVSDTSTLDQSTCSSS